MDMSTLNCSTGLPKGSGALQMRGRSYWMIYTDAFAHKTQVNAHTADFETARRELASAAIGVLRMRIDAIREALDDTQGTPGAASQGHGEA